MSLRKQMIHQNHHQGKNVKVAEASETISRVQLCIKTGD